MLRQALQVLFRIPDSLILQVIEHPPRRMRMVGTA